MGEDRLDVAGLERLIEHLISGGVHGLFILGTTGEGPSHSYRLRREVIRRTCRLVEGRLPVLVGISDTSLVESLELGEYSADCGADAVVFAPPYYLPPSQQELVAYSRQLIMQSPLPVVLYNMPALTKVAFEIESVVQLMDEPKVVGIKDSSGDLDYFRHLCESTGERKDWTRLMGAENLLVESMDLGGDGCVAGGANVWPGLLVAIYDAAVAKDNQTLSNLRPQLVELFRLYRIGGNAIPAVIGGIRAALEELGICHAHAAAPLAEFTADQRHEVREVLRSLDLLPAMRSTAVTVG
jgi:4-hydroxy-tetrahydrodipicolinate synthase